MTTTSETAPQVLVLAVGGTGESYPGDERTAVTGMLAAVTDALDERFVGRWVPYPASYGPSPDREGISYLDSVALGVERLSAEIAAARVPVMLIGYSQGAVVIRTALAGPGGAELARKVSAVGLVADPHQPPGAVPGADGWGVAGPGPDLPAGLPVFWVGADDDVICNASPDSLVRDIADLTPSLSLLQPRHWLGDAAARIRSGRMQNAALTRFSPRQWWRDAARLGVAAREVLGYLPAGWRLGRWRLTNRTGGRHVSYAAEPYRRAPLTDPDSTACQVLAGHLQVQATLGERMIV